MIGALAFSKTRWPKLAGWLGSHFQIGVFSSPTQPRSRPNAVDLEACVSRTVCICRNAEPGQHDDGDLVGPLAWEKRHVHLEIGSLHSTLNQAFSFLLALVQSYESSSADQGQSRAGKQSKCYGESELVDSLFLDQNASHGTRCGLEE